MIKIFFQTPITLAKSDTVLFVEILDLGISEDELANHRIKKPGSDQHGESLIKAKVLDTLPPIPTLKGKVPVRGTAFFILTISVSVCSPHPENLFPAIC